MVNVLINAPKTAKRGSIVEIKARFDEQNNIEWARKLEKAKADSAYDIAKEKCEDQTGDAQKVCKADAKAEHERALKAAKGKA